MQSKDIARSTILRLGGERKTTNNLMIDAICRAVQRNLNSESQNLIGELKQAIGLFIEGRDDEFIRALLGKAVEGGGINDPQTLKNWCAGKTKNITLAGDLIVISRILSGIGYTNIWGPSEKDAP